jgi:hypothetical protein
MLAMFAYSSLIMMKTKRRGGHSEKAPEHTRYGLPWCVKHDAYAPRRYNPFTEDVIGRQVAEHLCDECYADWCQEI